MELPHRNIFVHKSAIIDEGCEIGDGTKIWHFSHVMTNASIGENCSLGQNVFIMSNVKIGDNVKIQNNVSVYDGVICEDDVFIGPSAVFTNVINPRSRVNRKKEFAKTIVRKGATIGANATIICGNTIGAYSLIGAGTVVTKEVKNYALIVGNPGAQVGWVSEKGHKLNFNSKSEFFCAEENSTYKLEDDEVKKL
ncbi:acyltransferase [Ekhidna sp.]